MKSAYLLSDAGDLYPLVAEVLVSRGAVIALDGSRVVQWADDAGRLLTIFGPQGSEFEAELREPATSPTGVPVDVSGLSACVAECRSEAFVASTVRMLAAAIPGALWLLDSNGIVWPASEVDPTQIAL